MFRGTVALVEHRLARLLGIRQHDAVHMDDHLIPSARGAGVEVVMEGGFGDDPERIGLNLARRWCVFARRLAPAFGVQPVGGRREGLAQHRADLGAEPAADHEHAVFVLIDGE